MEVEQLKNVTYEIVSAVRLAHNNDEVAAIVLTGAGEKRKAEFKGR